MPAPSADDARAARGASFSECRRATAPSCASTPRCAILEGQPRDAHSRRARLAWRDAPVAPRVGERWRLLVRLAPLADTRNFAGPDPARFAFRDRVHLAGRVLPSTLNARLALGRIRRSTACARASPRASAIGRRSRCRRRCSRRWRWGSPIGMSADQWRVFNATGTTHLVAISGLHVTLFALLAFVAARFAWRWLPLARRCRPRTVRIVVRPRRRRRLRAAGRVLGAHAAHLAHARACSLRARLTARACRRGAHLVARLDRRAAARSARAAGGRLLAVVRGRRRHPAGGQRGSSHGRTSSMARAVERRAPATAPSCWRSRRSRSRCSTAFRSRVCAVNLVAIPLVSFVLVPLVLAGALAVLVAPALSQRCLQARGCALRCALARARVGGGPRARAVARDAGAVVVRVRGAGGAGAVAALAAGAAADRPSCAVLPLMFAPPRAPEPGAARVSMLDAGRGTARADRHTLTCAAVRYRRQLEHARRAPAQLGAAGARCAAA